MARRFSSLHPVNRIKHVVDQQISVPVNVNLLNVIVNTVDNPGLGTAIEVETGSTVNNIFCTIEAIATETSTGKTPNFYIYFYKNPGSNISTFPNANNVGINDNKRFIFHQEMVMIQGNASDDGVPRNVFKGVIKVPKVYRRNAPGDQIGIAYFVPSTGVALQVCLQAHYKEFR